MCFENLISVLGNVPTYNVNCLLFMFHFYKLIASIDWSQLSGYIIAGRPNILKGHSR